MFAEFALASASDAQKIIHLLQQSLHKLRDVHYAFSANLADLTWAEIDQIGQSGLAPSLFSVGDTKDITANGELLTVEIIGFNHDQLSTSSGYAPYTFATKNLMATTRAMNSVRTNSGSFVGSEMYAYLRDTVFPGLPSDLKGLIKTVNKRTSTGGGNENIQVDAMKIFLLSFNEVQGLDQNSSVSNDEGSIYPVFTGYPSQIKKLSNGSGEVYGWWLRSPGLYFNTHFFHVQTNGYAVNMFADEPEGVCFGFCV